MIDKKLVFKSVIAYLLIAVGIIGFLTAGYFVWHALYYTFTGAHQASIAEDEPGGLDGLAFVLDTIIAIVIGTLASPFFAVGMILRSQIKKN